MLAKIANISDSCNCGRNSSLKKSDSLYLDTLAEGGTNPENFSFDLVSNTSKSDCQTLKKRARRKYFGNALVKSLVDASRVNKKSSLKKSYWNTFHCAATLTEDSDGKISGRYCKNRWCMVCNSIRTAQLIKQYRPVFYAWDDVYFVTLTVPNIGADSLPGALHAMQTSFKRIHERYKKQHQRGQGERFKGFRKLEITYNAERNDFHPHFHFVVEGESRALQLVADWLREFPLADAQAQDCRKADDAAIMELFKYTTKVISGKPGEGRAIYADAMDIIFNAIRGKRTFQPFGFEQSDRDLMASAAENANDIEVEKSEARAIAEWEWQDDATDWVNKETGEVLANYQPGEGMKLLCEERILIRRGHDWTPTKLQLEHKDSVTTPARRSPKLRKEPIRNVLISPASAHRARKKAGIGLKDKEIIVIPFGGAQSNCKPA